MVGRPRGPPAALAPRLGAADAPPVAQALGIQCLGVQGTIGGQFVIGRDDGDGKVVDIRIADPVAVPHPESGQHGEPPGIEEFMAPYVGTRGKTHVANMPRHHHGDFGGAHVGDGADGRGDPIVRQIVLFGNLAVLDQQHDGVGESALFGTGQPSVVRNTADADLGGVHEVGVALDVGCPAVGVIGDRRPRRGHLIIHELGENRSIVVGHMGEAATVGTLRGSGFGGCRILRGADVVIAGQRFQGKQTVVKRPVSRAGVKYHSGFLAGKRVNRILPEPRAAKESTNAVDNSVENTLIERAYGATLRHFGINW